MSIENIENILNNLLPKAYKDFVSTIGDYAYVSFNEFPEDFPDEEGTSWFFWGENRLEEMVEIDDVGTAPAFAKLRLFSELDKSFRKRDFVPTTDGRIDFDRLAQGFSIAEDNGDLLYLDLNDNGSVWVYSHDSGEVKQLETDFKAWLSRAKIG